MYGDDETVYIMDAKTTGNIGRFLNVTCNHTHTQQLLLFKQFIYL